MKFVIVVDADVNVHDAEEVMWAIHTRFSPETRRAARRRHSPASRAPTSPACMSASSASMRPIRWR